MGPLAPWQIMIEGFNNGQPGDGVLEVDRKMFNKIQDAID